MCPRGEPYIPKFGLCNVDNNACSFFLKKVHRDLALISVLHTAFSLFLLISTGVSGMRVPKEIRQPPSFSRPSRQG